MDEKQVGDKFGSPPWEESVRTVSLAGRGRHGGSDRVRRGQPRTFPVARHALGAVHGITWHTCHSTAFAAGTYKGGSANFKGSEDVLITLSVAATLACGVKAACWRKLGQNLFGMLMGPGATRPGPLPGAGQPGQQSYPCLIAEQIVFLVHKSEAIHGELHNHSFSSLI